MEGRNTAEAGSRHKPAIRVAFGHQSVGEDLLQAICSQEMDDELVVRRSGLPEIHFRHRRIGANGNPESKIDDFVAWMESDAGSWAEVALFKFCYADITAETDLTELLGSQTSALRHLRGRFPETKFLQCTIPLTVNPRLIDRLIVGLRHRSPHPALLANLRRNEFNDRLRAASHSAFPLFDLAALESRGGTGCERCARSQAGSRSRTPDRFSLKDDRNRTPRFHRRVCGVLDPPVSLPSLLADIRTLNQIAQADLAGWVGRHTRTAQWLANLQNSCQ